MEKFVNCYKINILFDDTTQTAADETLFLSQDISY